MQIFSGKLRLSVAVFCLVVATCSVPVAEAQFFNALANLFRPIGRLFRNPFPRTVTRFKDDGTQSPQSTGREELNPSDCGRNTETGTGKLCFPDGILCENRLNRPGIERWNGKNYWLSWRDPATRNVKWDWFNARNYCRKRCMDLVSFESRAEYNHFKGGLLGGILSEPKFIWTSGRLCNFDGCDRDEFFPKNINGWFWSANQARLNPTNGAAFHDWSSTGGTGQRQPDNREQTQQGGAQEACLAVLNNFYGDGVKWHDVACHHEKPIICEDNPGHLNFARQQFGNSIP